MRGPCVLLTLALVAAAPAQAMTVGTADFTCPVDGKTFQAPVAMSGSSFGMWFDQQAYGAIASPPMLPVCPGNGFVMSPGHVYTDAERARIVALVATPAYRARVGRDSTWYRFAKQEQALGKPQAEVALALLHATWQVKDARYPRYAAEALAAMQLRAKSQAGTPQAIHSRLLVGELQRRLERFDDARATFQALRDDPGFPGQQDPETNAYLRKLLDAQLTLVRRRDASKARLEDDGEIVTR